MPLRRLIPLAALAATPTLIHAQQPDSAVRRPAPPAQPPGLAVGPPIRRIATATAVSTEQLGTVTSVRELPDGRVLVNDGSRRRLLVMDTTMAVAGIVLDSLTEVANSYGTQQGTLVPYRGDSTLFIDPASYAMLVLDPQGRLVRVRSIPRVQDAGYLSASSLYGVPGFDSRGRMIYRRAAVAAPPAVAPPPGVPYFPNPPDSAFIVAVDLDTRKQDTVGVIRIPKQIRTAMRSGENSWSILTTVNPLPVADEWAVLSDGTVAFLRWQDYRIDWLNPDGTLTPSAKIPFEWQRLEDADKERMVDSVRTLQQRSSATSYVTSMIRWANQYNKPYPEGFSVPEGFTLPPGMPKDWILPKGVSFPANYLAACPPGTDPAVASAGMALVMGGAPMTTAVPPSAAGDRTAGAPAGAPGATRPATPTCLPAPVFFTDGMTPPPPTPRQVLVMPADELPDYRPPFGTGSVRSDMDGNLWVRIIPPRPIPGGPVYDIVNRQGTLVDRLQLPPGYTLVGFGRNKVVYLTMRDAAGLKLARVQLK